MALTEATGYGFTPQAANDFLQQVDGYYKNLMNIFTQDIQTQFLDGMEYGWFTPIAVQQFEAYTKVLNSCKDALSYHYDSVFKAVNAAGKNWADNPYVKTTWTNIPFTQDDVKTNHNKIKETIDGQYGGDTQITQQCVNALETAKGNIQNEINNAVSCVDSHKDMFFGKGQVDQLKNSLQTCGKQINSSISQIQDDIMTQVKDAIKSLGTTAETIKSTNLSVGNN